MLGRAGGNLKNMLGYEISLHSPSLDGRCDAYHSFQIKTNYLAYLSMWPASDLTRSLIPKMGPVDIMNPEQDRESQGGVLT